MLAGRAEESELPPWLRGAGAGRQGERRETEQRQAQAELFEESFGGCHRLALRSLVARLAFFALRFLGFCFAHFPWVSRLGCLHLTTFFIAFLTGATNGVARLPGPEKSREPGVGSFGACTKP